MIRAGAVFVVIGFLGWTAFVAYHANRAGYYSGTAFIFKQLAQGVEIWRLEME